MGVAGARQADAHDGGHSDQADKDGVGQGDADT
jgi:hypothetical protein